MRVVLYARVSTDRQDEMQQMPTLRAYAENFGYLVVAEYTDSASGRDANRPGWKALMDDVRHHRCDMVIVTKLDRVMRSVINLLDIIGEFRRCGVTLTTCDLGMIETTSASGMLMVHVLGSVAEWEREIISERTKDSLHRKSQSGVKLGRPVRDGVRVHNIALMRIEGRSWSEIARIEGIPRSTLNGRRKDIEEEIRLIKGSPSEADYKGP